jgi:hypothetical protein
MDRTVSASRSYLGPSHLLLHIADTVLHCATQAPDSPQFCAQEKLFELQFAMHSAKKELLALAERQICRHHCEERSDEAILAHVCLGVHYRLKSDIAPNPENAKTGGHFHSIISSAAVSSVPGISRPSAFAVLRLLANSNFVAPWTGRSAGFSPLRMRSTYDAVCQKRAISSQDRPTYLLRYDRHHHLTCGRVRSPLAAEGTSSHKAISVGEPRLA